MPPTQLPSPRAALSAPTKYTPDISAPQSCGQDPGQISLLEGTLPTQPCMHFRRVFYTSCTSCPEPFQKAQLPPPLPEEGSFPHPPTKSPKLQGEATETQGRQGQCVCGHRANLPQQGHPQPPAPWLRPLQTLPPLALSGTTTEAGKEKAP